DTVIVIPPALDPVSQPAAPGDDERGTMVLWIEGRSPDPVVPGADQMAASPLERAKVERWAEPHWWITSRPWRKQPS
ncbi:MAG TPA: hypothetical protein VFS53_03525, partial [Gemmatimonadota bacterium]|nr:hypothetical protein [Gemmatimonadota bacterium]